MPSKQSLVSRTVRECAPEAVVWPGGLDASQPLPVDATLHAAKARMSRLTKAIEAEVIPRLVRQHRVAGVPEVAKPTAADVQTMVGALLDDDADRVAGAVEQLRMRGVPVATLFMDLLAPAARELGQLWEDDRVDFASVTVSLGRLQRLLRQLSPDFGNEVQHPPQGRRVLLTQPDTEQHMFGLSMVAEFFRREGWDVLGGVSGVGIDASAWVRRDWFDVVGFSIGSELSLPWLRDTIATVKRVSRNRGLVVLVGGPIFTLHPLWAPDVGADATTDGRNAPQLSESILNSRVQEQSGQARMS